MDKVTEEVLLALPEWAEQQVHINISALWHLVVELQGYLVTIFTCIISSQCRFQIFIQFNQCIFIAILVYSILVVEIWKDTRCNDKKE